MNTPVDTAIAGAHVVILLGSDQPPALRLYGAWCLDCGVKTAIGYPTPDKARSSLDQRAGHVDSQV